VIAVLIASGVYWILRFASKMWVVESRTLRTISLSVASVLLFVWAVLSGIASGYIQARDDKRPDSRLPTVAKITCAADKALSPNPVCGLTNECIRLLLHNKSTYYFVVNNSNGDFSTYIAPEQQLISIQLRAAK
jgi:hypothetical protein